jgi:hypothetical protein
MIPQIDNLLDQLKSSKFFGKFNLKFNYHQVPIESTEVWKTNFKNKEGLFDWLAMPFGLTNALTTFMRMMDDILQSLTKYFVVLYLYEVLIFVQISLVEHL